MSIQIFLGPKKNQQLAVLSLAPPNLSHIPSLPEPTLGGPTNQLPLLPSHQWGDLTHVLIEQPTGKMKVTLQAPNSLKAEEGSSPVSVLTPVRDYSLLLCLAAPRSRLSPSCACFQEILVYFCLEHSWAWK